MWLWFPKRSVVLECFDVISKIIGPSKNFTLSTESTPPFLLVLLDPFVLARDPFVFFKYFDLLLQCRGAMLIPGNFRWQDFCSKLVLPAFQQVGWDQKPSDDDNQKKLRSTVLAAVGKYCYKELVPKKRDRKTDGKSRCFRCFLRQDIGNFLWIHAEWALGNEFKDDVPQQGNS